MRKILTLVLAAGLFAALPPSHSQDPRNSASLPGAPDAVEGLRPSPRGLLAPKQHECVAHEIACGQTVSSQITTHDCVTTDGSNIYYDVWFFPGVAGQRITATMSSNQYDPFLILYDPDVNDVAEDDNSGPGLDARIVFDIDQTSPDWSFVGTPLESNVTGSYTLSLQCSGQEPPPPPPPPPANCPSGFFSDPGYPDFCFRVNIGNPGSTIPGTREPDCIDETVCVSGALPGRSELFLRIIGPRPNGYLWPTIVRFTPSRVVVDVLQRSSDQMNQYILSAVPPGTDDLPGRQDRMGFLP